MKTITAQQTEYLELCSTLNPLTKEYQVSSEELGIWQKEIGSFQAYVPLIGAYSSGKSSLLNAFLQQKLFRVKIDPCTDIAFEIFLCCSRGQSCDFLIQDVLFIVFNIIILFRNS
jgi:predicted GTPase